MMLRPVRWLVSIALGLALLLVPDAQQQVATIGLVRVQHAKAVDFSNGVIWILAIGADARADNPVLRSRADAIQLVGIDAATGSAAAIGIPRDSWVDLPGHGFEKINAGLQLGGPELMAKAVEELTGISPDYVLATAFVGFRRMVTLIGGVEVQAPMAFDDPGHQLQVVRGRNEFDSREALAFARSRKEFATGDFERSANQQLLMLGILRKLRQNEDTVGFLERGAWSVMQGMETDLLPTELYRLAQLITMVRPQQVTHCVVPGTIDTSPAGASIVHPDTTAALRMGADARDDAQLDKGCSS